MHGAARRLQTKRWLNALCVPLKHATPTQIVNEVLGGYAMKVHHSTFQPIVIGIDVLDMKSRFLDVLEAERFDFVSLRARVVARTNQRLAVVSICKTLGGGWEICAEADQDCCGADGVK